MSKFYLILLAFVLLIFSGCSFFESPSPKRQTEQVRQKSYKSAIKGFIKELYYHDSKYCYTIVATDTKNAKLSNANFCSNRYFYDKGDLVYATFIGNQLESMLLISEGSPKGSLSGIKKPQNTVIMKKKNIKTNIEIPKEEKITF
ncbi:MAG: hypothetical protein LUC34_02960 [Campylobacter sp.]|nr:hypothetical protein [Campylobacter sp.]